MSVGGDITPDNPDSTANPALFHAAIPPSRTETFSYPRSIKVAPAKAALAPSLPVTAMLAFLSGARPAM